MPLGRLRVPARPLEPGVLSHVSLTSVSRVSQVPIDHSDLVADLLKELSNHNERVEERKGALLELLKITREDSLGVWEEHFKTILLLLLETLGDKDVRRAPCAAFPRAWVVGLPRAFALCLLFTSKHVCSISPAPVSS